MVRVRQDIGSLLTVLFVTLGIAAWLMINYKSDPAFVDAGLYYTILIIAAIAILAIAFIKGKLNGG